MNKLLPLLLLLLMFTSCQTEEVPEEINELLSEIKQTHAPDKRVAIWNIEASTTDKGILFSGEINLPEAETELRNAMEKMGVPAVYTINTLPEKRLEDKTYGIVNLSACNIRSKGKHSAELATQSTLGTVLKVYKEEEGWYLVQTPDGYLGWLDSDGFVSTSKEEVQIWKESAKIVYLPDFGFSYSAPNLDSDRISDLLAGNILQFIQFEQGFAKVGYPDGRIAYIPREEVMLYDEWIQMGRPSAEEILSTAHTFIGRPYLWGGTSGKGVDCSGFTKTVFYLNGIMLPRDASQQVNVGQAVETDTTLTNLQAGDLLFFGRRATEEKKEKITHVAIYMGAGKIIHSAGQVKVESLLRGDSAFNEYRLQSFIRAKRMLPAQTEMGVYPLMMVEAYN
ncbi:MAG: C40 family peptidase [Chitinophagales bacterium]|nr:C40 family peptidase [Chitinophagales bacterium]